jgi:ferredoxin-NADP reductase
MPALWETATVVSISDETRTAKTFRLRLFHPAMYLPGQHYIVRLTAPDGYRASRSYSIASAPDGTDEIDLTVERLPGGEVSEFLHDVVVVGDELEVRGPIGGWFVWEGDGPALLLGGGSGVVPLMAMLRYARRYQRTDLVRMLLTVRTPDDLYYRTEIFAPEAVVIYSRVTPPGHGRPAGRLTSVDLAPLLLPSATAYVCGSSSFADAATEAVLAIGVPADHIRVERFGPTGPH